MTQIEQTIDEVEKLYRLITGKDIDRTTVRTAIPAEKDPSKYVDEQLERLTGLLAQPITGTPTYPPVIPTMSMWETDRELIACIDMPGVPRDHLHVEVVGDQVHVTGQRRTPRDDAARPVAWERPLGSFHRVFRLPAQALATEPTAKMQDGLLELHFAKPGWKAPESREVPVS